MNYALKVDSITCFRQQLFYLTELNSTSEIKPSLSVATVVVQYSKLLQPFLSRHAMLLLLCLGRLLRDETQHGCDRERPPIPRQPRPRAFPLKNGWKSPGDEVDSETSCDFVF